MLQSLKYPKKKLTCPYLIEELYRITEGRAIITTDVGQHQMWAAQFYKYTEPRTFITSGGQGPDEIVSESSAMKQYLMEHGIPESRIIEEDRSVNTHQNMLFSKEKIMAVNPEGKIAFATTNYHVFRSGLHARRVKMKALGMGAETKWYFWPNAAVREFVGLLTEHRGKQILILLGMIIVYAGLTIMKYRWGG